MGEPFEGLRLAEIRQGVLAQEQRAQDDKQRTGNGKGKCGDSSLRCGMTNGKGNDKPNGQGQMRGFFAALRMTGKNKYPTHAAKNAA